LGYVKSEARKGPKKGSSRLPEVLVNNVYLCQKKHPSAKCRKVLQIRLVEEQGLQFQPGGLGLDVGEIALREFCATHGLNILVLHDG
jgi:hypothetical protein